jgi:hypothetical protein
MSGITIPIEIELTQRSKAILAALSKTIGPQFQADDEPTTTAAVTTPNLQAGEHYAGVVLDESGNVKHHLVLMAARPDKKLAWEESHAWATSIGGVLPTRQEQSLLFANCKPHLKAEWHWSSETYESDASYAWVCYFNGGSQYGTHKSYEGSAVAVRRA